MTDALLGPFTCFEGMREKKIVFEGGAKTSRKPGRDVVTLCDITKGQCSALLHVRADHTDGVKVGGKLEI